MSRASCAVSGVCVIGTMRPLTLIDGATPAVMKRSDAFLCTISLRKDEKSTALMCCSRDQGSSGQKLDPVSSAIHGQHGGECILHSFENFLHLGACHRILARHQAAAYQILQALVHGLHAELLAGLDRRIHLRDLV